MIDALVTGLLTGLGIGVGFGFLSALKPKLTIAIAVAIVFFSSMALLFTTSGGPVDIRPFYLLGTIIGSFSGTFMGIPLGEKVLDM